MANMPVRTTGDAVKNSIKKTGRLVREEIRAAFEWAIM
jgi:hypothetical protein